MLLRVRICVFAAVTASLKPIIMAAENVSRKNLVFKFLLRVVRAKSTFLRLLNCNIFVGFGFASRLVELPADKSVLVKPEAQASKPSLFFVFLPCEDAWKRRCRHQIVASEEVSINYLDCFHHPRRVSRQSLLLRSRYGWREPMSLGPSDREKSTPLAVDVVVNGRRQGFFVFQSFVWERLAIIAPFLLGVNLTKNSIMLGFMHEWKQSRKKPTEPYRTY